MLSNKRGNLGITILRLVLVMSSSYIRLFGIGPRPKKSVDSVQVLVLFRRKKSPPDESIVYYSPA